MLLLFIYITRLASKEIFSPSNKIHRKQVRLRIYQHSGISACVMHLPHVRVCVANDLLYLSDMTDFDGNKTLEKRILNFTRHFLCDFVCTGFNNKNLLF